MSTSHELFPQCKPGRVVSASRRTDMVATDPDALANTLKQKAIPSETHTIVLWTKNPHNIFYHTELSSQLLLYDHCYVHLTITGLGGTAIEPRVPAPEHVLRMLPALVEFVQSTERLMIRFDPVVHFIMRDGQKIGNLPFFATLAPALQQQQIKNVTTSWMQIYTKVANRLARHGLVVEDLPAEHLHVEYEWLRKIAQKHKLLLHGCCVAGWPRSQCINGELLNNLHPRGYKTPTLRAAGQRALCGCSKSWDIGWYTACVHGCLYCYGHPKHYNNETK